MEAIFAPILSIAEGMGYAGVALLMVIESSFFPLPSEIVIPPFAYLASKGELNIFGVILAGTIGSLIGACFNYFLAKFIGQAFIYKMVGHRYAKYIFLNQKKMQKAEDFFLKNADASTFLGRLIPGIRHLISIPAGFFRMRFSNFLIYTAFGSAIWVSILSGLGYFFGQNQDLLMSYFSEITTGSLIAAAVGLVVLFFYKKNKRSKEKN